MALSVRTTTWTLSLLAVICAAIALYSSQRIQQIKDFNHAVRTAKTPETNQQSYAAKFATAYWLAQQRPLQGGNAAVSAAGRRR